MSISTFIMTHSYLWTWLVKIKHAVLKAMHLNYGSRHEKTRKNVYRRVSNKNSKFLRPYSISKVTNSLIKFQPKTVLTMNMVSKL